MSRWLIWCHGAQGKSPRGSWDKARRGKNLGQDFNIKFVVANLKLPIIAETNYSTAEGEIVSGHGASADEVFNSREHCIRRSEAISDEERLIEIIIRISVCSFRFHEIDLTYRLVDPIVDIVRLQWRSVGHFNVRVDI